MGMNTVELEFYRRSARRSTSPRAHAEGLVVDVVDGRLALRSEDSYAINEVVGN